MYANTLLYSDMRTQWLRWSHSWREKQLPLSSWPLSLCPCVHWWAASTPLHTIEVFTNSCYCELHACRCLYPETACTALYTIHFLPDSIDHKSLTLYGVCLLIFLSASLVRCCMACARVCCTHCVSIPLESTLCHSFQLIVFRVRLRYSTFPIVCKK